jgi:hypothetical protein
MHIDELKLQVRQGAYQIDPMLVAQAMVTDLVRRRNCWNPNHVCPLPGGAGVRVDEPEPPRDRAAKR